MKKWIVSAGTVMALLISSGLAMAGQGPGAGAVLITSLNCQDFEVIF